MRRFKEEMERLGNYRVYHCITGEDCTDGQPCWKSVRFVLVLLLVESPASSNIFIRPDKLSAAITAHLLYLPKLRADSFSGCYFLARPNLDPF
jgi:hypothetical protein